MSTHLNGPRCKQTNRQTTYFFSYDPPYSRGNLAVVNLVLEKLTILLGESDGTFKERRQYQTGAHPLFVIANDLNKDTKPDLVISTEYSDYLDVFIGCGDGSFKQQAKCWTSYLPTVVAIADINSDTVSDLVTINSGANSIGLFYGIGNGTFHPQIEYMMDRNAMSVVVGDFNGDLKPDLAVGTGEKIDIVLNSCP